MRAVSRLSISCIFRLLEAPMLRKHLSLGLLTAVMTITSVAALVTNVAPASAATVCDRYGVCWHDAVGPRDWHWRHYHHWRWVHNAGRPGWHRVWF
jgi:hypothetical protein